MASEIPQRHMPFRFRNGQKPATQTKLPKLCVSLQLLISFYHMSLSVSPRAISTTNLFCRAARIECHDIFRSYWVLHMKLCRENAKTTLDSSHDISEMPTRKRQFLVQFPIVSMENRINHHRSEIFYGYCCLFR
jgi:hypothetical protein